MGQLSLADSTLAVIPRSLFLFLCVFVFTARQHHSWKPSCFSSCVRVFEFLSICSKLFSKAFQQSRRNVTGTSSKCEYGTHRRLQETLYGDLEEYRELHMGTFMWHINQEMLDSRRIKCES
ncbi:hypothetical protein CEXT_203831 [Caerostris extrusa]|uniref:Secreted protein n=1 Tax=Caerostris extrusa TaxID=172846 RepID=A0AAV4RRU1_CAEEX|nr:hypothetical protein CEXT_203831 [Caerostris extrusa]